MQSLFAVLLFDNELYDDVVVVVLLLFLLLPFHVPVPVPVPVDVDLVYFDAVF